MTATVNGVELLHIMGTLAPEWTIAADPGSLTVPVLLTHGRSDYTVPHRLWDGIPATLPNATFRLFEASGHQPFYEEPERFTSAVTEWLSSEGSPGRSPIRSGSGTRRRQ